MKIPAISVIIPLYNAKKYIGECLDSVFEQTFQDFEVIVVDDCSTDNSFNVVKSYESKFNGRIKLSKTKKNSGGSSIPRNIGLNLARGDYLFFMDNDDTIIPTAFEKLYTVAKNFNADVVHCEKYYPISSDKWQIVDRNKLTPYANEKKSGFVSEPTLLENNIAKLVVDAHKGEFLPALWTRIIRREFVIANNIKMMDAISQDRLFNLCLLYSGGRHVKVPYIINYYRVSPDSMSNKEDDVPKQVNKWIEALTRGFDYLDEFLSKREFFIRHPEFKQIAMETFLQEIFYYMDKLYRKVPVYALDKHFRKSLGDDAFLAFTFNLLNVYRLQQNSFRQKNFQVNQLVAQAQKRITELEKEIASAKSIKSPKPKKISKPLNAFSSEKIPAVSVIIPLYNAEKYIGELLDSVFAQTFKNFEVIVVDDCSTDNSFEIVKNYAAKFGEQFKVAKTKKNTGGPAEPSNIAISVSRGEYLLILDNDDAITPTALEELYPVAKKFNADVVSCEKYYSIPEKFWDDAEFRKQLKPYSYKKGYFVTEPTLISDNLSERVKDCYQQKFLWNIWSKLIRRDFLTENKIKFNQGRIQDMLFTCCLLFSAKKYVLVPNTINYYRWLEDSLSHRKEDTQTFFVKYFHTLKSGFNLLDKFLSEHEFFAQNPKDKYFALETFVHEALWYLRKFYLGNPSYIFDNFLRQEFSNGDNAALMAYIFNSENVHRVLLRNNQIQILQAQKRIAELEAEIKLLKGVK